MKKEQNQTEYLKTMGLIIRPVNVNDSEEMARVVEIEDDPLRIRWFYNNPSDYHKKSPQELVDFLTNTKGNDLVFAVFGDPKREDIRILNESNKLQGLVYVNPETDFRRDELKKLFPIDESKLTLEVSYAKRNSALGGQMGKGVRQVCRQLAGLNNNYDRKNIIINAYIMTDERGTNEPSVKLLEASGFEETGRIFYDPSIKDPDRLFTLNWDKLDQLLG